MWWNDLPGTLLPLLLPLIIGLALAAPLYFLLLIGLPLQILPGQWELAGVMVDPTDLIFGALAAGLLLRARRANGSERNGIPYLGLWLLFGTYLLVLWLIALVAYAIARPFRWRM